MFVHFKSSFHLLKKSMEFSNSFKEIHVQFVTTVPVLPPKSDQHSVSPCSNTTQSNMNVVRKRVNVECVKIGLDC